MMICAIVSANAGNSIENFSMVYGSSKYHAFGTQTEKFLLCGIRRTANLK